MIADEKLALFAIFDTFGKHRKDEILKWCALASKLGIVVEGIIPYGSPEDPFSTPTSENGDEVSAPSGR
jgi:hypothetical protein